jgi:uncharacterized protein (TIGR00369 family)
VEPDTSALLARIDQEHFRKLEHMYAHAPINAYFKPTIIVSEGCSEICIPVQPGFFHAASAVHGCVYFKALDDAAFFASNSLITGFFVLTVSFNIHFLRKISHGEMRAFGRVIHHSSKILVADAVLTDTDGFEIGRGNGTFMPSRIPLSPDLGYI